MVNFAGGFLIADKLLFIFELNLVVGVINIRLVCVRFRIIMSLMGREVRVQGIWLGRNIFRFMILKHSWLK